MVYRGGLLAAWFLVRVPGAYSSEVRLELLMRQLHSLPISPLLSAIIKPNSGPSLLVEML